MKMFNFSSVCWVMKREDFITNVWTTDCRSWRIAGHWCAWDFRLRICCKNESFLVKFRHGYRTAMTYSRSKERVVMRVNKSRVITRDCVFKKHAELNYEGKQPTRAYGAIMWRTSCFILFMGHSTYQPQLSQHVIVNHFNVNCHL